MTQPRVSGSAMGLYQTLNTWKWFQNHFKRVRRQLELPLFPLLKEKTPKINNMFYHSEAKPQSIYTKTSEEKERRFLDEIRKNIVTQWTSGQCTGLTARRSAVRFPPELCALSVWSLQVLLVGERFVQFPSTVQKQTGFLTVHSRQTVGVNVSVNDY